MKKKLLFSILWLAAMTLAYVAGGYRSKSKLLTAAPSPAAVAGPVLPAPIEIPPTARARVNGAPTEGGSDSTDAARWVEAYKGSDGVIQPERMAEAVVAALRESDPVKSMLYFTQLVENLTPENAPAALKSIREGVGGDSTRFLNLLAHAWGSKDGKGALAAFQEMRGREGGWARSTALAGWAANDPAAALRWLKENQSTAGPESDRREEWVLSRGLISGLARRDVGEAMEYLMTLKEDQRSEFVGVLAEQKLKEGPEAASQWALDLPDERMRSNALESVSRQFLRQDLDNAAQWAEKIAVNNGAHRAVGEVADELAERSAPDAAQWATRLPPGASQNEAYVEIFREWTEEDPMAASQYLAGMTQGSGRDAAINGFSRRLARENPSDALAWVSVMTDPQARVEAQVDIARGWHSSAPQDAQAWIAANLPPEAQARVLAPDNGGRGGDRQWR